MEILNCLAVDDEPHALELLDDYVSKVPFLKMFKATTSSWEAIKIMQEEDIDLLFLDIQMNKLTGLQLLETHTVKCPVIITSAYQEYAIDGYDFDVVDYLLKPYSFERFLKAVNRAKSPNLSVSSQLPSHEMNIKAPKHVYIKGDSKNKFHRLNLDDIFYIEGLRNYVQFICKSEKIITLQNLQDLEQKLPSQHFIRVHRSYIINAFHIDKVDGNTVYIYENRIPIGQKYKHSFLEELNSSKLD